MPGYRFSKNLSKNSWSIYKSYLSASQTNSSPLVVDPPDVKQSFKRGAPQEGGRSGVSDSAPYKVLPWTELLTAWLKTQVCVVSQTSQFFLSILLPSNPKWCLIIKGREGRRSLNGVHVCGVAMDGLPVQGLPLPSTMGLPVGVNRNQWGWMMDWWMHRSHISWYLKQNKEGWLLTQAFLKKIRPTMN